MTRHSHKPQQDLVRSAASLVESLERQGKTFDEALTHARLRYGVTNSSIRRELGRRQADSATHE